MNFGTINLYSSTFDRTDHIRSSEELLQGRLIVLGEEGRPLCLLGHFRQLLTQVIQIR